MQILLHREWSGFHLADLNTALARIGPEHLLLALGLTFLSYFPIAGISLLTYRWSGGNLKYPWREVAVSFMGGGFLLLLSANTPIEETRRGCG